MISERENDDLKSDVKKIDPEILDYNIKIMKKQNIHIQILFNSKIKLKFNFPFQIVSNFSKLIHKIYKICTDLGIKKIDFLNTKLIYKKKDSIKEIILHHEGDYKNFIQIYCQKHFKILNNNKIDSICNNNEKNQNQGEYKMKIKCIFLGEVYLDDDDDLIEKRLSYYLDCYDVFNTTFEEIEKKIVRNNLINEIYCNLEYRNLINNGNIQLSSLKLESEIHGIYQCYYKIIENLFIESLNVVQLRLEYFTTMIKNSKNNLAIKSWIYLNENNFGKMKIICFDEDEKNKFEEERFAHNLKISFLNFEEK